MSGMAELSAFLFLITLYGLPSSTLMDDIFIFPQMTIASIQELGFGI